MTSQSTAKAKRSEATDARRLAPMFPLDADREKLLRHAKQLEDEADALDRQAAAAARPGLVDQRQAEQQQQQGDAAGGDQDPPRPPKAG
jgi:hypothetical protein